MLSNAKRPVKPTLSGQFEVPRSEWPLLDKITDRVLIKDAGTGKSLRHELRPTGSTPVDTKPPRPRNSFDKAAYPRFIAGERDCPPEDCGGIPGFYEMLEVRTDPAHPDHSEISEWLDEYDPDVLDVFPIQVALGRIAARRNAAAKRIIKPAND